MGKTVVVFKIKCREIDQLDDTVAQIKQIKNGEVRDVKREPLGFGIEVIKTAVLIPEKQDEILEHVQTELKAIPNVEEIEIEGMTLL